MDEEIKIVKNKRIVEKEDWIVYPLSDYEKTKTDGSNHKFSPNWSLPAKIREVKNEAVIVDLWGSSVRQVPLTLVHILEGMINLILKELNMKKLKYKLPQRVMPPPVNDVSSLWKEMLNKIKVIDKEIII